MMTIHLIYGGISAEHDVSVRSASSFIAGVNFFSYNVALMYITKEGQWLKGPVLTEPVEDESKFKLNEPGGWPSEKATVMDLYDEEGIVFPLLHGPNGEDGTIQGMLEVINMPYIGPGVTACSAGMDKIISKNLFSQAGIPQAPYMPVSLYDWRQSEEDVADSIINAFDFPIYLKPANMGSSVGITEANTKDELIKGLRTAFKYDRRVVAEKGLVARELEIALMGNERIEASIIGEIIKEPGLFNYEDKYVSKTFEEKYPADLTDEQKKLITDYAIAGFKAIDGNGMGRCDFFLTEEGDTYLNEINMIPGFYEDGVFSKLWEASGLPYEEMIEKTIQLGLERAALKKKLTDVNP